MAAERNWTAVLTVALGVVYVALGLAAGGWPGALGIAGGVATIALVAVRGRIPRSVALALLVVAVVPFAAATWTSVVTPILADPDRDPRRVRARSLPLEPLSGRLTIEHRYIILRL